MKQFKDKVASVAGGGSGIGEALCKELGQEEAIVVVEQLYVRMPTLNSAWHCHGERVEQPRRR